MEKIEDPISKPKVACAQVAKQKDLTSSDKFTKNALSTLTQIPTLETTDIEKYMQEEYHHRVKCLDPQKSDRKDQKQKCSSTTESDNDIV